MFTVGAVYPHSPAQAAGLRTGDSILAFGLVRHAEFKTLSESISPMVKEHVGRPINVVVARSVGGIVVHVGLMLTPESWSGKGLLGCAIK